MAQVTVADDVLTAQAIGLRDFPPDSGPGAATGQRVVVVVTAAR